jgi:hypothetical protein
MEREVKLRRREYDSNSQRRKVQSIHDENRRKNQSPC